MRRERHKTEPARQIAKVLAEFDAMQIAEGNPDPVDEYQIEADDIFNRILKSRERGEEPGVAELCQMLAAVFEYWFEEAFTPADFDDPARQIALLLADEAE